jgi:hypothetical protein
LSSSADDFRIVVSLAIDEPTLKPKMTARMAEMVGFRMAASLNGALACIVQLSVASIQLDRPNSKPAFRLGIAIIALSA